MTMRELMSHTAGLTYGVFGGTVVDKAYTGVNVMDPDQPMQAMIDKLAKIPLLFQPGERWHYSLAVDVQGYLVEKLSGKPFPEFLKERIFDPLRMTDTAFYVPAEKMDRFAAFYTYDKERKLDCASERRLHEAAEVAFGRRRTGVDRVRLHAFLPDAAQRG